ncbi:RHS repeat-associated core domain-containing protein [Clostridium thailandense]|uniref:RHS repeat-associated core domain-containing protein n=1 Tax=Clostridium thailandense TaxID=2794346 RepID=UPI0039899122
MNLNGVEYYYIRNGQGDIIGLFDNTTKQLVKYVYDTWGKLISIKDVNGVDVTNNTAHVAYKNPYRYRGYRYDNETELYYLNSRYYNLEWGRYINADAVAGGTGILLSHNVFAYSMNNPANMVDPNGYLADFIWGNQEYDEPHVDVITSAAPVIPSGFNAKDSAAKASVSDRLDKAGEVFGSKVIKKSKKSISYGTWEIERYVSKPRLIGKVTLGALGKAGTIAFTTKDLIGDFRDKRYFSAGVDATSALVGAYAGAQIIAGAGIAAASLGLIGVPAIVFIGTASLVGSVLLDYVGQVVKDDHYRGK